MTGTERTDGVQAARLRLSHFGSRGPARPGADILHWRDFTEFDRRLWAEARAENPAFRSPYFAPDWFDALSRSRRDIRALRLVAPGGAAGFLPLQSGAYGARPAGWPLSDWHGVVAGQGALFDLPEALRIARLRSFAFAGAPADDGNLAPFGDVEEYSPVIDLAAGLPAYFDPPAGPRPRYLKAVRRHRERIRREGREARFLLDERAPDVLDRLIELKSAQYRRTGKMDIFAWPWVRRFIADLFFEKGSLDFSALISTLRIDGDLAAIHFGIRSGPVLHYWFPAYDLAYAAFAPGVLLMAELVEAAPAAGILEIDLGVGDYRFKREFANASIPILSGVVHARSADGRLRMEADRMVAAWERLAGPRFGRAPRKLLGRIDRTVTSRAAIP